MAAITQNTIRQLAGYRGEGASVTSGYLAVDTARAQRHGELERSFERLLKSTRERLGPSPDLDRDAGAMTAHLRELDRSATRGLAMFSCSADGFWRAITLRVPVRDQLVVQAAPAVAQLEQVLGDHRRSGVLLVDRQRARVLVHELGEIVASTEVVDALPRAEDDDHSRRRDQVRAHISAAVSGHLRNAARAAFTAYQETSFERLVLGAPDDLAPEIEAALHPYLRSRIVARCSIPVAATDEHVMAAVSEVETTAARDREAASVRALRDAAGGGGRAVVGLDASLSALFERRVDELVVSSGFGRPGWRCEGCGRLQTVGRTCRGCGAEMVTVADVVEHAVDDALASRCRVAVLTGSADLDVAGSIGAFLRY